MNTTASDSEVAATCSPYSLSIRNELISFRRDVQAAFLGVWDQRTAAAAVTPPSRESLPAESPPAPSRRPGQEAAVTQVLQRPELLPGTHHHRQHADAANDRDRDKMRGLTEGAMPTWMECRLTWMPTWIKTGLEWARGVCIPGLHSLGASVRRIRSSGLNSRLMEEIRGVIWTSIMFSH